MLELTQVAYQLLLGESTEPGVEIDEAEQLALEKNWEETLRSPPVAPPSPAPSPSKAVSRRHLLSPTKSLGAPRRVLAPLSQQQAPVPSAPPAAQTAPAPAACMAAAPARRTPAAIRFTAAPKP